MSKQIELINKENAFVPPPTTLSKKQSTEETQKKTVLG